MSVNMAGTASTQGLYHASYEGISGFVDLAIGFGLACFTRPVRVVQDDVDIFDNDSFDSDMERQVSPLQ